MRVCNTRNLLSVKMVSEGCALDASVLPQASNPPSLSLSLDRVYAHMVISDTFEMEHPELHSGIDIP